MQFSIVIPVKNEEKKIGICLDSLSKLDWNRNEYEIIVVDNGSTDQTATIAREKADGVFILPELTISALRNFGAKMAKGEVLAFIDADCTVQEDWLRAASIYLAKKEIICFGSPPIVPDCATWVQKSWFQVRRNMLCGEVEWLESMNMFVRRDIFIKAGGFNEKLVTCEDYDLSLRLKQIGTLIGDKRIVAVHHGEAATVLQFFRKEFWRGRGNLYGLKSHRITWKELPSIALPILYCAVALLVTGSLMAALLTNNTFLLSKAFLVLLAWQGALALLALWKNGIFHCLPQGFQLYLLLNVYLLARGCSMLQRNTG